MKDISGYLSGICMRYASDRQEALDMPHESFRSFIARRRKVLLLRLFAQICCTIEIKV